VSIHKLNASLRPGAACLFLDVDGTLLEFGPTPDAVHVDAALLQLLQRIAAACHGAVALISGRSLRQLDTLFPARDWPVAGLHGAERRDAQGRIHRHSGHQPVPAVIREALEQLVAQHPGSLLEEKGAAIALHYRLADATDERHLRQQLEEVVRAHGNGDLVLQPGACVFELKPAGVTKATAIEAFLEEPPFAGRQPLFAGDDLTDLHGFEAVERHGGVSIAVGPRVSAMINVASPAELRALLVDFVGQAVAA
jgi:trehalose 6-phosphate phosphatase